jgi:predicted CoA-binding protein
VQLFRRPSDIPAHVDDILAANPRVVWMQLGIRHDAVAEQLARAGISVVQNKCFLVELKARGR